jgi:Flavodoxin domain
MTAGAAHEEGGTEMTVLVTAASEHGATREIADRIGADLAEHGITVEVKKPEEMHGLAAYDALVIGSAIYMGQWLKPAKSFVETHTDELAQRPTWLETQRRLPRRPAQVAIRWSNTPSLGVFAHIVCERNVRL